MEYNRFFYSCVCHVCKSLDNIKRCSKCKAVAYCSKDHQMLDWECHKKLCKVISHTYKLVSVNSPQKFQDFKDFKVVLSVLWKDKLGRQLEHFEEQIWMFPRVCIVCFSKNVLLDCQNCLNVSYCSENHKDQHMERHSKYCGALKLCMDIDLYYFNKKHRPTEISIKPVDETVDVLPCNLEKLMTMCGNDLGNSLDEKIKFIIKANYVGSAATILYGLERSGLVYNRNLKKNTLSVHIVGADTTEMVWIWKIITESIFHWIQDIKLLEFFVIGPELGDDGVIEIFADELCDDCKKKNPKTTVTFCCKLYHDIIDSITKPDIVTSFNSGLHEFHNSESNNWKDSIKYLVKCPNVPLVLTAYTLDEIMQDIAIVKENSKCNMKTILEPKQNPFSNMTPIRDWENENTPIFYVNGYIAVLAGTL